MADVYGVQATKHVAGGPANTVDAGMTDSKVLVMMDTYEAAALAAGSTIQMGKTLPIGSKIVDILIHCDALGSATLAVGDTDSSGRYITAYSVSGATKKSLTTDGNIDGKQYTIDGDDDTEILLLTASTTITGTINCQILYTMNR